MPIRIALLTIAVLLTNLAVAESADLAFKAAGEGTYEFNTGTLKGKVRLGGRSQGMTELVDVASGTPIAHGGNLPGVFSYYRLFTTDKRYGHAARDWPTVSRVLADGSLEVRFTPPEEVPFKMTAVYRWKTPDTLDVQTIVTAKEALPRFEVFLSSYFVKEMQSLVYVRPSRFGSDKPRLMPADVNPLVDGTYLMFPRDVAATKMIVDGRWEHPPNAVQWSITRLLAGPMAVRHDRRTGLAAVVMSRPEDCFAVSTPYNKSPPDGVAGHASLYLSLFGHDLKQGETARAHARLVILRDYSDAKAVEQYEAYCKEQ